MYYPLDFSLNAQQRCELVKTFDLSKATEANLNTLADYLCFGKNEDGSSPVKNHEIEIETKRSKTKKPESLDLLLEDPAFDETSITTAPYKQVKITINKDLPEFKEINEQIDLFTEKINKEEKGTRKRYDLYMARLELYRLRYQIQGSLISCLPTAKPYISMPEIVTVRLLPDGCRAAPNDPLFGHRAGDPNPTITLDLEDKTTMRTLLKTYDELPQEIRWTLDYYAKRAQVNIKDIKVNKMIDAVKFVHEEIMAEGQEEKWHTCAVCGEKYLLSFFTKAKKNVCRYCRQL